MGGVYDECVGRWENDNDVMHQATAAHDVPVPCSQDKKGDKK